MVGVGNVQKAQMCEEEEYIQVFAWDVELKSKKKLLTRLAFSFYVKTSFGIPLLYKEDTK